MFTPSTPSSVVIRPANDGFIITPQVLSSSVTSSTSSLQRTLIRDGVTTVYSTFSAAPSWKEQAVVTRSRIFVSKESEEEDTSDEGFPGVALVTELPRFNLESEETRSSPLSEEEEEVVSSEAFR